MHKLTNIHNLPTQSSKSSRKSLGRNLETSLKCKYISDVFLDKFSEITNDPGSKLSIYGRIKTKFEYENYLNHDQLDKNKIIKPLVPNRNWQIFKTHHSQRTENL